MRKALLPLSGAIFLVACYLLYSSLDASYTRRRFYFDEGKKNVEALESKLRQLETDLDTNQQSINQIRNSVFKMVGSGAKTAPGGNNSYWKNLTPEIAEIVLPNNKAGPVVVVNVPKQVGGVKQPVKSVDLKLDVPNAISPSGLVCSLANNSVSTSSNIQMLDVYEMLEFENSDGGVWKQGWDITYDRESVEKKQPKLKVFVVPHSHDDPGWIKTFEKYYLDQVKAILNNMVEMLTGEKRMKFIYAEMSFFERWWQDISADTRHKVKALLDNGQFEIVTGAWVMTDEANAHYFSMLDQMIEGHQWLQNHLNYTPSHHWSIDPFGLSSTMPYLLQLSQFSSLTIQRVHYAVKKHLARARKLEFNWRQLWASDNSHDIFTHMFPFYSYDVPHTCGPDPKICCQFDFKRLPGGQMNCPWHVPPTAITADNVNERATTLLDQYRKKAQLYKTNVLLIPLGDDFRYDTKAEWVAQFENYDKLFAHMNLQPDWNVEARFGTLGDYFTAVAERVHTTDGKTSTEFPVLSGDFFTYADRDDHYWSGYYTSRPYSKRMDRVLQHYLRGAEILMSQASSMAHNAKLESFPVNVLFSRLVEARRNLAVFQHHDGITGTAKDHVVVDYTQRLLKSIENCQAVIAAVAHLFLSPSPENLAVNPDDLVFEMVENRLGSDSVAEHKSIQLESNVPKSLIIYNSLPYARQSVICLFVSNPNAVVVDAKGLDVPIQIQPIVYKLGCCDLEFEKNAFELCFYAKVNALGIAKYTLTAGDNTDYHVDMMSNFQLGATSVARRIEGDTFTLSSAEYKSVTFSSKSGLMQSVIPIDSDVPFPLRISFISYGTTSKGDKSGAYLFMPDGPSKTMPGDTNKVIVFDGPLFSQVVVSSALVKHTVKVYKHRHLTGQSINIENEVDIASERNVEIGMKIESGVKNKNREFFTDLNGFQMLKRKFFTKIALQGNFYPMPAAAYIEDSNVRVTLLTGQPLGVGAGIETGAMEVIMDRRLMQDDNRGLGQGVTDNRITPSYFRLAVESLTSKPVRPTVKAGFLSLLMHHVSMDLTHPPFLGFQKTDDTSLALTNKFAPLDKPFPCDTHLVNLRSLEQGQDYESYSSGHTPALDAALIIHQFGHECRIKSQLASLCLADSSTNQLTLSNVMGKMLNKDSSVVSETSLTMLHNMRNLSISDPFVMRPMDIKTFRIRLR